MIMMTLWIIAAVAAVGAGGSLLLLALMRWEGLQAAKAVEIQLNGLGETHKLAFEAVTTMHHRLEDRIKRLEDERR